jgi:two-component system sensor kinase FixL
MSPAEKSGMSADRNREADTGVSGSDDAMTAGQHQRGLLSIDLWCEAVTRWNEGVLITNEKGPWPDQRIVHVNQALCRLTGYAPRQLVGKTPRFLQIESPDLNALHQINKELQTGLATLTKMVLICQDQTLREFEVFIVPLLDTRGCRTHLLAIFRDLCQEKNIGQAGRINETSYSQALELTGMLHWTTNGSGEFIEDCPLWRRFTGKTFSEITGLGWTESIHPDDFSETMQAWNRAVSGRTFFESTFRLRRFDGSYRSFLGRAVPVYGSDAKVDQWLGICVDITERKRNEDRITADLDAMMRLNQLANLSVNEADWSGVLEEMAQAAATIAKSDFANIQLLDPVSGQPAISAEHGFPQWWNKWWNNWLKERSGDGGQANRQETSNDCWVFSSDRRIIIDDTETSWAAADQELMVGLRRADIRALVSTPLISRSGSLLGRISTFFRNPHQPDEFNLVLIDLLAIQSADILERRRSELDLRLAYQRLKKVLEVDTVGVMYWDSQTSRLTDANPAFLKMLGYQRQDLEGTGLTWQQFTPSEYLPASLAEIEKLSLTGRLGPYEKECLRQDGSKGWFLFAGRSLGGNQCVEFCLDISDRKQAEQLACDREERLTAVLNTASDAIITIDHQGEIVSVNPATERLFGYQTTELIGQGIQILMPKPYSNECETYIRNYLETGVGRIIGIGREAIGKRKDGSVFPIDLNVSEIRHLGLFTGIVRDISERKSLQRDVLSIAEDEQRRIGQDLHDGVQQDLAGIGMLTQTLFDNLQKESNPDSPTVIKKSLQVTRKILTELKRALQDVRQISQGLIPIQLGSNGLADALQELALRHDGINETELAFKCEKPIKVTDSTTVTHLFRIAQEAVTNALKHSQARQILIELQESAKGNLILKIADDGVGFNPQSATNGLGLKSMRYRAGLIGAHLLVSPLQTGGTLVTCKVFSRSSQLCR